MSSFERPKPAALDPEISEMIGCNEISHFAEDLALSAARSYLFVLRDVGLWAAEEASMDNPVGFFGALRTCGIELADYLEMCRR